MPDPVWIRMAVPSDWPHIRQLVEQFHAEYFADTPYTLNMDSIPACLDALTSNPNNVLLVAGIETAIYGLIAGCITTNAFDASQRVASEMMWYVSKSYRGGTMGMRLLKDYEIWAKKQGASLSTLVHLDMAHQDRANAVYERLGYAPVEVHAVKEL